MVMKLKEKPVQKKLEMKFIQLPLRKIGEKEL